MSEWLSKVVWNMPLWDMHDGIPDSVPVVMPDGTVKDHLYRIVCQYDIEISNSYDVLHGLRGGKFSINKFVYPIAQTAEGFIVAAYSYDDTRFGMLVLNICGLPVFEDRDG